MSFKFLQLLKTVYNMAHLSVFLGEKNIDEEIPMVAELLPKREEGYAFLYDRKSLQTFYIIPL